MRGNLAGLNRAHRRASLRWNKYRCAGTTLKGSRCMASAVGRPPQQDGNFYCGQHQGQGLL